MWLEVYILKWYILLASFNSCGWIYILERDKLYNFPNFLSCLQFKHRVTCYYAQLGENEVNFTLSMFLNFLNIFWVICQQSHADLSH